jgi:hypothetical protein
VKRREFIPLIGGTTVAWPLACAAQQPERKRRRGMLMTPAADDPQGQARLKAFQAISWTDGRNVQIDVRWPAGSPDRIRSYAAELVALAPDVILASGSSSLGPLQQITRTVPIVLRARSCGWWLRR